MSYEGYSQLLCNNGHYWTTDASIEAFGTLPQIENSLTCTICKHLAIWKNMVNTTNGSYDENNNRIDEYIELVVNTPIEYCTCEKCSTKHISRHETYIVPNDKRIDAKKELELFEDLCKYEA